MVTEIRPAGVADGGSRTKCAAIAGRHSKSATTRPKSDGCGLLRVAAQSKNEVGTMSDIGERVKKIVVEHLGVEPDKVTEQASFIDDLGADSLDTVELVMAFEEEFHCEIPDDAAETILTVGDAVKFLEKNAKG
jgi:acyl carrier protein